MKSFFKWGPIFLGLAVFISDFALKAWTHRALPLMGESPPIYPYGGIPVFKNFLGIEFSLSHTINKGAAWGLGSQHQMLLLYFRMALIAVLFGYILFFNKDKGLRFPFALILAGAIGNVVDYFIYGHVVDMFHFVLWGYDFPVFNLADSAIFLGIVWLILRSSHSTKK